MTTVKVHPITHNDGPEGGWKYSYTFSSTSALDGVVGGQRHAPSVLPPEMRLGTHCTGGWGNPLPIWAGAENVTPNGIRLPDRPTLFNKVYDTYRGRTWRVL